ncbi:MAG: fibronectin type III domain-containing protein [Prevotella sp.]|nr:fibronectin type III domain-containing protein [Prevotella sp.]
MMKHLVRHICKPLFVGLMLLTGTLTAMGQDADSTANVSPTQQGLLTSCIHLLTRTYGDHVALRWVPEDYVSWRYLCQTGVNVLRVKTGTLDIDTLHYAMKPLTKEAFEARYQPSDSLAMIAMGVLYGEGRIGRNQTQDIPGSVGSGMELNNEQDLSFGYAMLVAEWRPDLAEAMAVGCIDRTARRGEQYDYYIQPTVWDTGGKIIFEPGVAEHVVNEPYKPQPYNPELRDSLTAPRRFVLSWIDNEHSSFEIERREQAGTWQRLNEKPYLSMVDNGGLPGLCLYADSVTHDGTWQYRILALDAFGTLTEPSPVHTAYAYDIEPPKAPQLKRIVIERPDDANPSARVRAHVIWQNNDSLENDLAGYVIQYYNERLTQGQWRPISLATSSGALIPPTDTIATIDVTGLRTGMLSIWAYDEAGNAGRSLSQLIRITDYQAPSAPDSLRAEVLPTGHVILSWQPRREDIDIAYYDLAFANDSTHEFLQVNQGGIPDALYIDSLALNVNQKYIYYKVRAVDYESNFGEWSPILQVMRPHKTPPTAAHLDESWHKSEQGMHMRWIVGTDADMTFHELMRRLGDNGQWQVIARWNADSIAATGTYAITVDDNPSYHQTDRYYYMVVSHNSTTMTTQSLAVSWLHQGPRVLDIPIRLNGAWVEHDGVVRLIWETDAAVMNRFHDADYYYCVFRKGQSDTSFRYMYNGRRSSRST